MTFVFLKYLDMRECTSFGTGRIRRGVKLGMTRREARRGGEKKGRGETKAAGRIAGNVQEEGGCVKLGMRARRINLISSK